MLLYSSTGVDLEVKIITNNAAYVQKNDLAYLIHSDLPVPADILINTVGDGSFIVCDDNRYDFIEFKEKEAIIFFKSLDWIVDYNEVKDLSDEEIMALGQSISSDRNEIAQKFNSMTSEQKQENLSMITQHELLGFKLYSLSDVLFFKQGNLKMTLPEEVEPTKKEQQEKGIKKLIKSIFKKN